MATFNLAATKRTKETAKEVRSNGRIPAVIYGPGIDEDSWNVSVDYQEFRKTFRVAGESSMIHLAVDGEKETVPVLVHIADEKPVSGDFEHIDFYAMDMKQEVTTNIPLVFEGTAAVEKEQNGIIITSKTELSVKCLPKDLVHDIKVDISSLENFHDNITIADITIPEGITVLDDMEETLVTAVAPKLAVEEEETAEEVAEGEPAAGEAGEAEGSEGEDDAEASEE